MKTLALAVAVLTAAPLTAADLADVKARGTLRVIVMPLSATDEFFPLPAGARPGFDRAVLDDVLSELERPERVLFFELEPTPVSSTEIRDRAARGEPLDGLVPQAVAERIVDLGLYGAR
jgi:hypothetical protein